MPLSTEQMIALPLIGLVAGVLGGLLGIGGGLVIIPALLLTLGQHFGPGSLHVYKCAALATAIVLSVPAARQHLRSGAVIVRMLPALEIFAVVGVIAGVFLSGLLAGEATRWLQRIFGVAMIVVVVSTYVIRRLRPRLRDGAACPVPRRAGFIGTRVGLPAGFVSGLLGIGGGVWAVPAQNLLLHIRLTSAIANSTCLIIGVALTAAIAQSLSVAAMPGLDWRSGWILALWLSPGALVGGGIGGRLTHVLPIEIVRTAFHALLVITGLRLMV